MHARTTIVAMTALALLAGCNRGAANNSAGAATTAAANSAAAAAPAAAPPAAAPMAAGQPVDAAFLTANPWAPPGGCAQSITFNPDGTATSGGEDGSWALAGNNLTTGAEGEAPDTFTVSRNGADLVLTKGGMAATVSPCPAG